MFNYSSSYSSILTGLILLPSAILGTISGGFLVRRFHLTIFGCIKLIFISCLISLISLILILFLKCQSNIRYSFDDQCSQKCHCSSLIYEPVCYENQINYLSPCYAGCTNKNQTVRSIQHKSSRTESNLHGKFTYFLVINVKTLKNRHVENRNHRYFRSKLR